MMSKVERRYVTQEFRVSQEGDPSQIGGYAAVFDSPSEDMGWIEEIDSHAFDSVVSSNPDVRALWNHNDDHVLGRTTAGTLRLNIDSRGLAYECDLPDTQLARDLVVSMRRKDITGSSFGFITKRDQWTENSDGSITRRILEVELLLDVSPVTYPAYPAASSSVRNIPDSMPVEIRSRIENRANSVNEIGCDCACAQCRADSCNLCSDEDCDSEQCRCVQQRSISESDRHKMAMRLALFNLKGE